MTQGDALKALRKTLQMMEDEPGSLARALGGVLSFLGLDGAHLNEEFLIRHLKSGKADDLFTEEFGAALANWDSKPDAEWTRGTEPRSRARRDLIYECLEVAGELRDACEAACPPYILEDSEKQILITERHAPWYEGREAEAGGYYWKAYAKQLKEANKFPRTAINSIHRASRSILERLGNPHAEESFKARGLVVGYVQSGKTANLIGLVAKAVDAGYRLVIILAGMWDILRNQTQRRLDRDLVGRELLLGDIKLTRYDMDDDWDSFVRHDPARQDRTPRHLGHFDLEPKTGPEQDYRAAGRNVTDYNIALRDTRLRPNDPVNLAEVPARIFVVKKNKGVLHKLAKDLTSDRLKRNAHLGLLPALIIDDESDQASIDTSRPPKPGEDKKRTKINAAIVGLLKALPRAQYVGYTATPFANCFIDPDRPDDLYPRDFILALEKPAGYMGVKEFYDWGDEAPVGYASNERAFLRDIVDGDDSMRNAIDSFVLSGAIKLWRAHHGDRGFKHHTMLVHTSHKQDAHDDDAEAVRELVRNSQYVTGEGMARLRFLLDNDFAPINREHRSGVHLKMPRSLDELRPYVEECWSRFNHDDKEGVLVINGRHRDDPNFERGPVWSILVGGNKLSRGYTIQGLTVSYYTRPAKVADTTMQMGRWFGFRAGYGDLVRVWLSTKGKYPLREAFRAICQDEEVFRAQLKRYEGLAGVTPRAVPALVPSHMMPPVQRNKMFNVQPAYIDYAGEWTEPTFAPDPSRESEKIRADQSHLERLLRGAAALRADAAIDHEGDRFQAHVVETSHEAVVAFLVAYKWPEGKERCIARQLDYLREEAASRLHDVPRIDISHGIKQWLVIAPQLKEQPSGHLTLHVGARDLRFRAVRRARANSERFRAYTDPKHRAAAEALAGAAASQARLDNAPWTRDGTAIMLVYPARAEENDPVHVGFAMFFPRVARAARDRPPLLLAYRDEAADTVTVEVASRASRGRGR